MTATILIVDDDPVQRRLLEAMVRRFGYDAEVLDGGAAALARLEAPDLPRVDLLICDLVMPEVDGMTVLARMRDRKITVPAIVQTAHGTIDTVISAMRAGATDFVVKPVGAERLSVSIKNALRFEALEDEVRRMTRRASGVLTFRDIVTKSDDMGRAIRLGERAARSTIPVLIEGESGVGKELMARAIQGGSDRKGKPFVPVNCGALPENLIESILFGHEKGAFTGATEKHLGKFVEANGGTLFLDEIGELPLEAQVKLLRALQEGEVDPVGAKRSTKVDVRLISATNQNLIELVKSGRFREDLFYRLNVFPVTIPPLRARRLDVADLARRFAARFAAEEGKKVTGISAEALVAAVALRLAGQRPTARERAVPGRRPHRRRRTHGRRVPADRGPGRRVRRQGSAPAGGASPGGGTRDRQDRDPRPQRPAAARRVRRCPQDGGYGSGSDPLRAQPLPGTDVRNGAKARDRPFDALSEDEGLRLERGRGRGRRRSRGLIAGRGSRGPDATDSGRAGRPGVPPPLSSGGNALGQSDVQSPLVAQHCVAFDRPGRFS